jgi:hypothetical protein
LSRTENPKYVSKKTFDFPFSYSLVFFQKTSKALQFSHFNQVGFAINKNLQDKKVFKLQTRTCICFQRTSNKRNWDSFKKKVAKIRRFSNYKQELAFVFKEPPIREIGIPSKKKLPK